MFNFKLPGRNSQITRSQYLRYGCAALAWLGLMNEGIQQQNEWSLKRENHEENLKSGNK